MLPQPVRCLTNCCADPTWMTLCIDASASSQRRCSYVLPQPVRCFSMIANCRAHPIRMTQCIDASVQRDRDAAATLPQPVRCFSLIANCCAGPTRMMQCIDVPATSQRPAAMRCRSLPMRCYSLIENCRDDPTRGRRNLIDASVQLDKGAAATCCRSPCAACPLLRTVSRCSNLNGVISRRPCTSQRRCNHYTCFRSPARKEALSKQWS